MSDILQRHIIKPNSNAWHKWFNTNHEFQIRKQYCKVLKDGDKSITCLARHIRSWAGNLIQLMGSTCRYITPVECERLQTVPDDSTRYGTINGKYVQISDTQRYKMLGNGFNRATISHILRSIPT